MSGIGSPMIYPPLTLSSAKTHPSNRLLEQINRRIQSTWNWGLEWSEEMLHETVGKAALTCGCVCNLGCFCLFCPSVSLSSNPKGYPPPIFRVSSLLDPAVRGHRPRLHSTKATTIQDLLQERGAFGPKRYGHIVNRIPIPGHKSVPCQDAEKNPWSARVDAHEQRRRMPEKRRLWREYCIPSKVESWACLVWTVARFVV